MVVLAEVMPRFREWSTPRAGTGPFRLACTLDPPASRSEIVAAWPGRNLPDELVTLWLICRRARLFEDIDYGQWGLAILSPEESAARTAAEHTARPDDHAPDDIVVGAFLGDLDLLILAPAELGPRRVQIAMPLDGREDWVRVAGDLAGFFDEYLTHLGDKYWEHADSGRG